MEFRAATIDPRRIAQYVALFRECFPRAAHYSEEFLRWQYVENPVGLVCGTDAIEHDRVVAHYACVPATLRVHGRANVRALLSLNTATHPDYQGRGLFTKLAMATYDRAASQGCEVVYGVANANSIAGFSRKLGFQNVRGLNARIGIGDFLRINWAKAKEHVQFERVWTSEDLAWRQRSPSNPLVSSSCGRNSLSVVGKTSYPLISVRATLLDEGMSSDAGQSRKMQSPICLSLGLEPAGTARYGISASIPDRLKPSPLRLIYRNLQNSSDRIDPASILFTFLDFDAY